MPLTVAATVAELRAAVAGARRGGLSVGLVPTMGALHDGHGALIRAARVECGFVVVTVFVNPTQFGPHEDFHRYPRPFAADCAAAEAAGADLVFAPSVEEMYPPGSRTFVEVTQLQDVLEGASRPGHFRGVATVVLKLFNQAQPDVAYFGQKDAQQVRVVQQMVADLNVPVRVAICPTVREPDGLALSSRNRYLDPEQRRHAIVLSEALAAARDLIGRGERDPAAIEAVMAGRIRATPGAELDYARAVDADTLRGGERLHGPTLLLLAVRFGATRLIDNLPLNVSE
jgi:pantoate--beta-alanine ligase